jgi:hypothetical protein
MHRLFGNEDTPLNLSHVPCCGLEWLLFDGIADSLATKGLVCLNVTTQRPVRLTRAMVPCGTSLCPCKQEAFASGTPCLDLQNLTVGVDGTCQDGGCPSGYRLYHTGSLVFCLQVDRGNVGFNDLTLFETACQGLYVIFFLSLHLIVLYLQCFGAECFRVLRGGVCVVRGRAAAVHGVPGDTRAAAVPQRQRHPAVPRSVSARILPLAGTMHL